MLTPVRRTYTIKRREDMKKLVAMMVAALMTLNFVTVVLAEEKKEEKPAAEKAAKKDVKKDKKGSKKDVKKDAKKESKKEDAKPAVKGKKEVSGC
jgi:mannitol-specific phosphotransferase system IIBC component